MRVAADYAALAFGDGLDDAAEAVATAGAYVDDTFAHLCGEALQLHGGIGFTWEHDVHLFARRAKVNQVLYGDGAWHRERLVRLTEAAGGVEDGRLTMDVIVPAIPDSYDHTGGPARLHRHAQACARVEAAHRAARAGQRGRRRAAARLRPGPLRRRVRLGPLLDGAGRPVRAAHHGAGARRGRRPARPGQPARRRRPDALRHRRAAGHVPTADGAGRPHLDPALQRARRRERPDGVADQGHRDGDDYVIVGQKVWSTWAHGPISATCWPAPNPSRRRRHHRLHPGHAQPGRRRPPAARDDGDDDFNEVFFDEVGVPAANIIGAPGTGWKVAGASLVEERTGVGGGGSGRDPVHVS